jgi:outer membrane protein W
MFKKFATIAAVGMMATAASSALAIDHETQKWELQLIGSGTNDTDFEGGSFSVTAQLGYFFTDQWEVAVRQGLGYADTGADSTWTGSTRVGGYYHFNMDKAQVWVPYVGASIGYSYGDLTDDSWVAGPEAGIRYYVNSTTFINASVSYDFLLEESFGDGVFNYGLGIGFQW